MPSSSVLFLFTSRNAPSGSFLFPARNVPSSSVLFLFPARNVPSVLFLFPARNVPSRYILSIKNDEVIV